MLMMKREKKKQNWFLLVRHLDPGNTGRKKMKRGK
jgi:hypothetical protein